MKQKEKPPSEDEFQEIAHCGGKVTIRTVTDEGGVRKYSVGIEHCNPNPGAWFAVYALPQGVAVETIILRGIGDSQNPPPVPDCFQVFIASDSAGCFGHLCPSCQGYWRAKGVPSGWLMTCPYCGVKAKAHAFLTEGQAHFVQACCELYRTALAAPEDGEHIIDLDMIADKVSKGAKKPEFYYAEVTQQNKYTCAACGKFNDILGKFGFCSYCGTRNDLQELEGKYIPAIRDRINNSGDYAACVQGIVSGFDSMAGKYVEHLVNAVPMTPARTNRLKSLSFHNLEKAAYEIKNVFDIDILKGLSSDDRKSVILMFHRRHVYEHKGGEADQKYIDDSGDKSVSIGQALHEDRESAHRTANLVVKMAKNLHVGFHSIFPPDSKAIEAKPKTTPY